MSTDQLYNPAMIIQKAFKFQLKTQALQEVKLMRFAGSCRKVWNLALALQKKRLDNKQYCLNYNKLAAALKAWKADPQFFYLKETHSQCLQQTLMNLDRALKEAFDKKNPKRFPQIKKRGKHDSFRYPQGFKIDEKRNQIYLPKLGWFGYRNSRALEGIAKNITVSRFHGKWTVSIQTEQEMAEVRHPATTMVGIDLGVANFASLSNAKVYPAMNYMRHYAAKLAHAQRALSRKKKHSKNWHKQRKKVSRIHLKITHLRQDFLHKTSTEISKNHAMIVLEDLKVSNMSRSAKGTKAVPGKKVRVKSGLNKAILDQGWSEFRRQLEYKQEWRGGEVLVVPAKNTSRCCSVCGNTSKENRRTRDRFCCLACGYQAEADFNAAKNILAAGHAVLACGGKALLGLSMKQEPIRSVAKAA